VKIIDEDDYTKREGGSRNCQSFFFVCSALCTDCEGAIKVLILSANALLPTLLQRGACRIMGTAPSHSLIDV